MQLLLKDIRITKTINEEWIKKNCYIAGGACVSNFTRKKINDVDIYFKTKEARDEFIAELNDGRNYITKGEELWKALIQHESLLNEELIKLDEKKEFGEGEVSAKKDREGNLYFHVDFKDCNISNRWKLKIPYELFKKQKWMFKNGYDYVLAEMNHFEVDCKIFLGNKSITINHENGILYQFILRFYGEPNEMMDTTFDFQHCKIAYDLATNEYIASQETWECLSKREIKYVNSFYPISSLKRLYKYAGRGFTYTNDEFVKIIRDIHKVDVDNKYVMEDQLIGYYEDFDYELVFGDKDIDW